MIKKTFALLAFSCSFLTSFAQTAKEEIYADILKSGSNHMAYQAPTQPLTKAPKGYEPSICPTMVVTVLVGSSTTTTT